MNTFYIILQVIIVFFALIGAIGTGIVIKQNIQKKKQQEVQKKEQEYVRKNRKPLARKNIVRQEISVGNKKRGVYAKSHHIAKVAHEREVRNQLKG